MSNILHYQRSFAICAAAVVIFAASCADNSGGNVKIATLDYTNSPTPAPSNQASPTPAVTPNNQSSPRPITAPSSSPTIPPPADEPAPRSNSNSTVAVVLPSDKLMIPVVGIKAESLRDTFNDARSEGRVHDAIDIMAAGGTPVVAATNGKIIKFFDSVKGGITIYQLSPDQKTVYYYAHLQRRADNVKEGDTVQQGTLIGYVGDTGNAGPGNTHLHFAIWTIADPKKFYDGTNLNPYPILKQGLPAAQR